MGFGLGDNTFIYHLGVNNGRVKCINIAERVVFVINSALAGNLLEVNDLAIWLLFEEHRAAVSSLLKFDGAGLVLYFDLADAAGYASISS